MKCEFSPSEFMKFEVEGGGVKDIFEAIGEIDEIFADETCGACGSANTRFVVRTVDDNKYYERACKECNAKLAYGQNKKGGGLFPKRKIEVDGKEVWDSKNRGWAKYVPPTAGKKK